MEYQKKILGIIFIIVGALQIVLLSLISAVLFMSTEDPSYLIDHDMPGMFRLISLASIVMMILLLALPSIIVGIGLQKKKNWANDLILPLGCFYLLFFPIGTAIGIYGLVIFFSNRENKKSSSLQQVHH